MKVSQVKDQGAFEAPPPSFDEFEQLGGTPISNIEFVLWLFGLALVAIALANRSAVWTWLSS